MYTLLQPCCADFSHLYALHLNMELLYEQYDKVSFYSPTPHSGLSWGKGWLITIVINNNRCGMLSLVWLYLFVGSKNGCTDADIITLPENKHINIQWIQINHCVCLDALLTHQGSRALPSDQNNWFRKKVFVHSMRVLVQCTMCTVTLCYRPK